MIDFVNGSLFKLGVCRAEEVLPLVAPMFIGDESIMVAMKGVRDFVVFTSKRIIAVNVQGMSGKKKDFTSLPYSRIQAYSIETAGTLDLAPHTHGRHTASRRAGTGGRGPTSSNSGSRASARCASSSRAASTSPT